MNGVTRLIRCPACRSPYSDVWKTVPIPAAQLRRQLRICRCCETRFYHMVEMPKPEDPEDPGPVVQRPA